MPRSTRTAERTEGERRRRARIRPAYLALLVILGLFAFAFVRRIQEVRRLEAQAQGLQQQNAATAANNQRLRKAIKYYRTNAYLEEEARSVLGYTMPGDISILTKPHPAAVVTVRRAPPTPPPTPAPSWEQWWQVFTHS